MVSNIPFDWLILVSPTDFLWKLTLSQLNPGQPDLMKQEINQQLRFLL